MSATWSFQWVQTQKGPSKTLIFLPKRPGKGQPNKTENFWTTVAVLQRETVFFFFGNRVLIQPQPMKYGVQTSTLGRQKQGTPPSTGLKPRKELALGDQRKPSGRQDFCHPVVTRPPQWYRVWSWNTLPSLAVMGRRLLLGCQCGLSRDLDFFLHGSNEAATLFPCQRKSATTEAPIRS